MGGRIPMFRACRGGCHFGGVGIHAGELAHLFVLHHAWKVFSLCNLGLYRHFILKAQ